MPSGESRKKTGGRGEEAGQPQEDHGAPDAAEAHRMPDRDPEIPRKLSRTRPYMVRE
jgi:hypothetical protein